MAVMCHCKLARKKKSFVEQQVELLTGCKLYEETFSLEMFLWTCVQINNPIIGLVTEKDR